MKNYIKDTDMFDGKPLNKFLHDEFEGKSREQLEKD